MPRYRSTSARTGAGAALTRSMTALASRVSGIAAGSILSRWASHSAASASASARTGAASGCRAGVRTGLPSSSTVKPSPSPPSPTLTR